MDDPLNSSQWNASAANSGFHSQMSSFEKGLAALQRKDYAVAIAHLEAVCDDTTLDRRTLTKAQMGLVKAYEHIGEVKLAIALCQPLCASSSRQVRSWAANTLAKLVDRYPEPVSPSAKPGAADAAGFVSADTSLPEAQASASQAEASEATITNAPSASKANAAIAHTRPSKTPQTNPLSDATERQAALNRRKQAGRAVKWAPLGAIRLRQLQALELGTTIALFLTVRAVVWTTLSLVNRVLMRWTWIVDLRQYAVFYSAPFWQVLIALVALLALAPWLLDRILKRFYGLKPLTASALETHSPEANRILKRVCSQRRYPLPQLGVLPTAAPVAMTYGCLPHTARIVISQGLLEQLSDDEIAAIYASELAHIADWSFAILTLVTLVAQLPYLAYRQIAAWGDRQVNGVLRAVAAAVAAGSYGLYWLFHWIGRWLSRSRLYYSDRFACDLTGNPNGLTRALLKTTLGLAQAVQQQGYTSPLLESFDLLMPVGHRTALTLGSVYPDMTAAAFVWDQHSPGRFELAFNNAHPLMGDRLHLLNRYANHWRLEPELDLALSSDHWSQQPKPHRSLRLQGAPVLGGFLGVTIALTLWLVGAVAGWLDNYALSWLWRDRSILLGCLLMGFSFGTFLRMNAFFPDIRASNLQVDPSLPDLLCEPIMLPVHSQPVRLQGKLLGRQGIENWLVQDLMLETAAGTIKLHYLSQMGAPGNLLLHPQRPDLLVGQPVTITGWFRRGATPWIDVDTIQPQHGAAFRSGHPLWSALLAGGAALWAAYVIAQGSL